MPECSKCRLNKPRAEFFEVKGDVSSICVLCHSATSNRFNWYARRDESLRELGYAGYAEYLDSDLWRSIRGVVLKRSVGVCEVCRVARATQVHHRNYSSAVMRGERNDLLVPVCGPCHTHAEFNGKKKVSLNEANSRIDAAMKGNSGTPTVKRKPPKGRRTKKQMRQAKKSERNRQRFELKSRLAEAVACLEAMRVYALWHHLPSELIERADPVIETERGTAAVKLHRAAIVDFASV